MTKSKAVRMAKGTIVLLEGALRSYSYGERLARVEHVTPNGGVLLTRVEEVFAFNKPTTYKPVGPAEWWSYHKVQLWRFA